MLDFEFLKNGSSEGQQHRLQCGLGQVPSSATDSLQDSGMRFPPLWASLFSHKVRLLTVPLLSTCIAGSSVIYRKHSETAGT